MRVRYRDQDELDDLGCAAFLRVGRIADRSGYVGGLLTVNARGEPLEFTYNRVETPQSTLWRAHDLRRAAVKQLAVSLLETVSTPPAVVICLALTSMADLFLYDIELGSPICLVPGPPEPEDAEDSAAGLAGGELRWLPEEPLHAAVPRRLVAELERRGLLLEPFERTGAGLREVYAELLATTT
jgi:hypothetical protein